ncbi:dTDP-4-dehydrorhamnose reductase [Robertkochia aurantiaca]|uniref:dTDP-4-dehydrorhamnose reductase n=1 Tax=Robertkochia aurantiaca TaxID=2873700 RepID=UPI001CC9F77E|nr:dTDP-4-dehydrorhamnose reductase [Robertkochia sp. 3YJGBD-33]
MTHNNTHIPTILVTGSASQLALTLRKYHEENSDLEWVFCSKEELDITNRDEVEKVFERYKPDYCINCAAYTAVDKAEEEREKAFTINAEAVKNLAEACKTNGTILIHISTDYVFDGMKREPYKVTDQPNPLNVYGQSKLKGEQYVQAIMEHYFIVRVSWLYSKEFGKNFYRTIVEKARKGEALSVVDDQTGRPTNTKALSDYLVKLIRHTPQDFGIKHFSDGGPMSWFEFAQSTLEENGLHTTIIPIKTTDLDLKAERPRYSVLDVTS